MSLLFAPYLRASDQSNAPIPGAFLSFYQTQTSTPQPIYADAALTIALSNPQQADANGVFATIYLDDSLPPYKAVYQYPDVDDPTIPGAVVSGPNGTIDPYNPPFNALTLAKQFYPLTAGEFLAGVTPTAYQYQPGNVLRYGADPTAALDSTAAFNTAAFANLATIIAPTAYKTVYVPAGQYKITDTVYVPTGTVLHGDGMSTYIDASSGFTGGTKDVFKLGWSLVAGVPTKNTGSLTGGYPPEIYGLFVNGGPASAYVVEINFPGALCHDIWFSAPGTAVYLAGGYFYDSEVDGGLTGMTVGPGINQTVDNVRFFNQSTLVNFDTATGNIAGCTFTSCTFEYPKIIGIQMGAGTISAKGIKFVGCDFPNNPASSLTGFSNCVSIGLANAQVEFDDCSFSNWGCFQTTPNATFWAALVQAAGAVVDFNDCLFDGAPANPATPPAGYTPSTNGGAILLNQGTVRINDCRIRNLAATWGFGIGMGGTSANFLEINGLSYFNCGANTLCTITNTNAASRFFASNVKGDGASASFVNNQSTVPLKLKSMTDWFGGIGASGSSNFVLVPYQVTGIYTITFSANQGVGSGRKSRLLFVEKDNDTSTTAKSLLNFISGVQGADNSGAGGNPALTLTVEFGTVGGTTSIAASNSGSLAISWPNTYTFVSIDVQCVMG